MTSVAVWVLTACGVVVVLIGGYFVAARPPLLAEDARYLGSTVQELAQAVPALSSWLRRVFWVLGGFALSTGVLVIYVAQTVVNTHNAGGLVILTTAATTSAGIMTVVNFMIRSAFKWALLALYVVWTIGLLLAAIGHG